MKTIYLLGATLAFALFSCSNDNDALISTIESAPLQTRSNQQIGFSVVNGCVYFTDMNAYQQVLLSLKEK